MKRIVYIILLAMGMATIVPMVSIVDNRVSAVFAVDDKAKAKAQKEKEKAKAAKEKEKAKAQAAKEKEKAKAQAAKEKEKAQAAKEKEKAQAAKEKEKAKAQAQREKEKAQAAKAKEKAKSSSKQVASKPSKAKSEPELSAAEEKAQYMKKVEAIDKSNARAEAYNTRDIAHRLGFWGLVGYSNLFTSGIQYTPATNPLGNPIGFKNKDKGFVGGGLGLGYQLRYKQFIMTVGAEFTFYNSIMAITNQENGSFALQYGMEPYANTMIYHYDFAKLNEKIIGGFAQIPLLFGMELKNIPLFWQAGVKVGMGVLGQSTTSGTFTTSIEDKELIGGLTDMYNHTLVTDQDINRPAAKANFGLNVAASAEIGVNLDRWINASPRVRASLFADYGVLNALGKIDPTAQDIPTQMLVDPNPLNFGLTSALATTSAANAQVHPFLVGAKIAVWFDLPRKQKQMEEQQKEFETKEFSASAGGGAVEVVISGKKEFVSVKLAPEVVDPDDIEMLQDLIIAAANEAMRKLEEENNSNMNKLAGGLGGMGIGGLM